MGNVRRRAPGEVAPSGLSDVHGVAHCLRPADLAKLTDMEHEYRYQTRNIPLGPKPVQADTSAAPSQSAKCPTPPEWHC